MGKKYKKKGARRYRIKRAPGSYVQRDKRGRFKKWTKISRSIRVDARKKAKNRPKRTGYGYKGDYPKRRRKK